MIISLQNKERKGLGYIYAEVEGTLGKLSLALIHSHCSVCYCLIHLKSLSKGKQ